MWAPSSSFLKPQEAEALEDEKRLQGVLCVFLWEVDL